MRRNLVMAAVGTLLASSGAIAQQQQTNNSAEEPRFQGVYGGITAGYGDFSSGGDGEYVDFFLGGRIQRESGLVYGIEAAGGFVDSDSREGFLDLFDGYGSIIGKVGYTPNNKVMWYGGAGYTSLDVANEIENDGSSGGVMFEAGLEYMPTSWFGIRLRGQYHAVGSEADITSVGAGILFSF